ncbi:MAG: helix-turn-helix transcriptional regulator [Eubacteriales bacterium]
MGECVRIGEAVRKRILELCDERGITLNKLATICGITQSTLNNIINGRNNSVTIATIKKICDGLNISVIEFFSSDAFDSMEQEIR